MTNQKKEYVRLWQKSHKLRMRKYKLAYYYKRRKIINLMFSKPTSIDLDEADLYYAEKHPEG